MERLKQYSTEQLEVILENYPWFTAARSEYLSRLKESMEEADLLRVISSMGVFLNSRVQFANIVTGKAARRRKKPSAQNDSAPADQSIEKPFYHVVGGDYFSKSDYSALERSGESVAVPDFNPVRAALENNGAEEVESLKTDKAPEDGIITETLASVYSDQQFYSRAIEIYEKLILLYPEKSAYFASLIEKIKNINK